MYRVDVTPVLGLPQFSGWSQVVTNQDNADSNQKNHLICALAVAGEHAGNTGRNLASQVKEAKPDSATSFHQFLSDLEDQAQKMDLELTLAAGLFSKNKMILGAIGGSVLLKRETKIGILLRSDQEIEILEGKHLATDILVLATRQADHFFNEIEQKFLRGFGFDSVISSIIPGLHDLKDSSLSSLAFISGGKKIEPQHDKDLEKPEKIVATDHKKIEALVDIPPALKLRGAGKKRTTEATVDDLSPEEPVLAQLGQIQSTDQVEETETILKKIISSFKRLISGLWRWLRVFNWRGFFRKIKSFLIKIGQLTKNLVKNIVKFGRRLSARDIYLKSRSPRQLLRIVLPTGILVLLLIGGMGFKFYQVRQQEKQAAAILEPYQNRLADARQQLQTEPVIARKEVNEIAQELEELGLDYEDQRRIQNLIVEELNRARSLAEEISGQEQIDQLEIFYDLRVVDENFISSAVDSINQKAAFLDVGNQTILAINLENKQTERLILGQLNSIKDLELDETNLTLLNGGIYQTSFSDNDLLGVNGVDEANTNDSAEAATQNPTFSEIIAEGDSNRSATLLETYSSYIYVLNPEKRDIYRYSRQETGYSDPIGWVSGAVSFDYDQVSSWAIDGEIWVATREGEIHRLAAGSEQDFSITGLTDPFTASLLIFTNENLNNLYVLEPDQNRLVVLSKDGQFLQEIKSASLASTTDLFVSDSTRVFAISGSIIYEINLP